MLVLFDFNLITHMIILVSRLLGIKSRTNLFQYIAYRTCIWRAAEAVAVAAAGKPSHR